MCNQVARLINAKEFLRLLKPAWCTRSVSNITFQSLISRLKRGLEVVVICELLNVLIK